MQKSLFEEIELIGLSIDEAAEKAKVSSATIRNWIKTGYLTQVYRGYVELNSFNEFMKTVAGKEKLTQRSNKLMKDKHDQYALSELIKKNVSNKSWKVMGTEYENSLSNSYKNKEGIYYTPNEIIDDMFKDISVDKDHIFLDPCCGSGNFVIQAIKKGVQPKNVYGFDFDSNAVEITKKRILEETGFDASKNIKRIDFLESAFQLRNNKRYDLIFTNPPWGKKITKKEKEKYARVYGAGKSFDTTSLFYFASFSLLKQNGVIGFLVQDALFNIGTFQDTRNHILKHKLNRLIDYGKPFKNLLTKAYAFILENKESGNCLVKCLSNNFSHIRVQATFKKNPKSILNFWINKKDSSVIEHIYALPHTTLHSKAKWGLGIVTGNNSKYCISKPKDGYVPIFKGSDITHSGLKTPTNYIPSDFLKYQQVAPVQLYQAKSKLIYKFISSKLVFFCDTEQRFILNSSNFLIPNNLLDISYQQLADLLSSDFMNWLFTSLFNTHKVLRGDLEQLPIHSGYFCKEQKFNEKLYLNYLGLIKLKYGTYRIKDANC